MALTSGSKLGLYEIQSPLGAGGMGEVYRAKDTRLGRDVALKVLPESFTCDVDRLRRFEQEARAVAALSHPNILAIHDIGEQNGSPFLVSFRPTAAASRSISATRRRITSISRSKTQPEPATRGSRSTHRKK
jgi:serine/threonine protein kinase